MSKWGEPQPVDRARSIELSCNGYCVRGQGQLRDRSCLVTGASRGLGRQIAQAFWNEGASLCIGGRDRAALDALADELATSVLPGQKIVTALCDLADSSDVARLAKTAEERMGTVTVLVNNAAMLGPIGPSWENDQAEWHRTLWVNLFAPVALCTAAVPMMQKQGYGKIINLSGGGATSPRPSLSAYAVSKAGLVRFTETLAHETRGMNIDANCVAPGSMNTRMLEQLLAAGPERVGPLEYERAQRQAEEGGAPLECAAALCVFLASGDSDGITGRLISAIWDPWETLPEHLSELCATDIYTLRRIVPEDRGMRWSAQ